VIGKDTTPSTSNLPSTTAAVESRCRQSLLPANGWTYATRVKDRKALATVKVGHKVDITGTEALTLSLDDGT
jgi:hypothetical protein